MNWASYFSILIAPKFWTSVLASLGGLWSLVEATSYFRASWVPHIREYWWLVLGIGVLIGLVRSWPRFYVVERISNTDIDVKVVIGDVFTGDAPILVAATTTFDTNIEDTSISPNSMQGQFTGRYFSTESEFKETVRRELDLVNSVETLSSVAKPYGPRRRYSRGELIRIRAANRTAYMFALATLNAHKTAELSTQEYMDSLPIVWNSLRTKGDLGSVNCPLIGAGFSRLNLTKEMILTQIVRSFVAASREGKLLESLTIYISRTDFKDGRLTLEGVSRILDFECKYNADLDLGTSRPGIDASETAV